MPLSLYQASVPVYLRLLAGLAAMIDKAEAHAKANKYDVARLLNAHLYPDMWTFAEQVQAVASHARRGTARLAGLDIPKIDEAGKGAGDLKRQIAETVAFLKSVDPAAVEAGAEREITFPVGNDKRTWPGAQYWLYLTLPNFYFHLTTAYDILRTNGVPVTKPDFLGGF
jgi:uncharacterized protein